MPRFLIPAVLSAAALAAPAFARPAQDWEIGPVIKGKNYSVGMPLHPTRYGKGWHFDFPTSASRHVHYVTRDPGSMSGKSKITVRYRIDAAPGVRFVPQQFPDRTATMTLYFQRGGDTWTAKGAYEFYRWFASPQTMRELEPGIHELTVSLSDPRWGSVMSKQAADHPKEFRAALVEVSRVGMLFGSKGGRGHGVFATGPARFVLLDFRIE